MEENQLASSYTQLAYKSNLLMLVKKAQKHKRVQNLIYFRLFFIYIIVTAKYESKNK